MKILDVKDRQGWRLFHRVLHRVYKNDSNYIYPLEREIENVFNANSNKVFDSGEAKCFVLLDDQNHPVGRIAAFIDRRNRQEQYLIGGIGFFECIQNDAYADALFKAAETYLKALGVQIIEGPINFGERDRFWGLLVKGFYPPLYQENYNPPYY